MPYIFCKNTYVEPVKHLWWSFLAKLAYGLQPPTFPKNSIIDTRMGSKCHCGMLQVTWLRISKSEKYGRTITQFWGWMAIFLGVDCPRTH